MSSKPTGSASHKTKSRRILSAVAVTIALAVAAPAQAQAGIMPPSKAGSVLSRIFGWFDSNSDELSFGGCLAVKAWNESEDYSTDLTLRSEPFSIVDALRKSTGFGCEIAG